LQAYAPLVKKGESGYNDREPDARKTLDARKHAQLGERSFASTCYYGSDPTVLC
jgi:hypothetical protein